MNHNDNTNAIPSSKWQNLTDDEKAVAEAWLEMLGPHFGKLIQDAMLAALRQHAEETGASKLVAEARANMLRQQVEERGQVAVMRTDPTPKPVDEQLLNLVGEFDAAKWAKEFKHLFPNTDEGLMLGWFANAIMAGYDHKAKEERKKLKTMQDCLDIQGSKGNWDTSHYMLGMFNGMEHMMAIMEDRDPEFRSWPKGNDHMLDAAIKKRADSTTTSEVPGEREVWAQAYAAALQHKECIGYRPGAQSVALAAIADEAVKAFRERYK